MKKSLIFVLLIALIFGVFTACDGDVFEELINNDEPTPAPVNPDDPKNMPLTLEFIEDGKLYGYFGGGYGASDVYYSLNGGTKTILPTTLESAVTVVTGDKVVLYRSSGAKVSIPYFTVRCTSDCYVYGNVMSLIDPDDFANADEVAAWDLNGLFENNTHIKNHDSIDIVLPATTLNEGCYVLMFKGCTGLTRAPELPAETIADRCYDNMFYGCTNLETAPVILPATTVANSCYASMFAGCVNLTSAPELPAKTMADYCYSYMFSNCTSLETAPELPATTLALGCYYGMFSDCSELTTAPVLPAKTLVDQCYGAMFYECTKLNAITCLATGTIGTDNTYYWMVDVGDDVSGTKTFTRATDSTWTTDSEDGIPTGWDVKTYEQSLPLTFKFSAASDNAFTIANPASTLEYSINGSEPDAYTSSTEISVSAGDEVSFYSDGTGNTGYNPGQTMIIKCNADCVVYGNVMSLLSKEGFESMTSLASNSYAFSRLFNQNTHLKSAEGLILPATTLVNYCYYGMFNGCTSLTTAPALPAATLVNNCYNLMFNGCTSLTTAPDLPATSLAQNCYASMFWGCSSLSTAPDLPGESMFTSCYANMFRECTSLTTAPILPAETLVSHCYYSMFKGCSNLTSITCLATSISADSCTSDWVEGVSASGTFTRYSDTIVWPVGNSGSPSGWEVEDYYK